jgi:hypothetical protein
MHNPDTLLDTIIGGQLDQSGVIDEDRKRWLLQELIAHDAYGGMVSELIAL